LGALGFEPAVGFFPGLADVILALESKPENKTFTALSFAVITARADEVTTNNRTSFRRIVFFIFPAFPRLLPISDWQRSFSRCCYYKDE